MDRDSKLSIITLANRAGKALAYRKRWPYRVWRVNVVKYGVVWCLVVTSILACPCFGEFAVNTRTSDDQTDAAVAMDANENFVVVWSSYRGDGNSGAIFGRRFDANCKPVGDEFQINTTTAGNQTEPAVAMDANGNFVVVWHGPGATEQDKKDVFGQRFDANAQPVGGEFCVNSTTSSWQQYPQVAVNEGGGFVVVWESEELGGVPSDAWGICGQLFDGNGSPLGGEFDINLLLQCRYPDVAMNGSGNFTIVWMQEKNDNSIMMRLYNADGTAKAAPCEVSTISFSSITRPSIGMDGSGHFVVAWDGHPDEASLDDIHARRYRADGSAVAEQFVVNTSLAYAQDRSAVAMNNWREFVIVWNNEVDPNTNERDIFGQRYDELCNPIGDEFRVNTYVVDDQKDPAVAIRENGEFVAAWQSYGQDGSDYGVFGKVGPRVGCADFSEDSFVNFVDYCVLAGEWLEEGDGLKADLIDDNRIDERDLDALCGQWLMPCYDCNEVDIYSDGRIDFRDYGLWAGNWLKQGPKLDGDITGDGIVDMADLKAMVFHWAKSCGAPRAEPVAPPSSAEPAEAHPPTLKLRRIPFSHSSTGKARGFLRRRVSSQRAFTEAVFRLRFL